MAARMQPREGSLDQEIYNKIHSAIVGQRLRPGTKLGEGELCDVFDASRSRIRRVLITLAHRNIVDLHPNRGAFVSKPTAKEARDVFEARRAIELTIVRRAAERISRKQIDKLKTGVDEGMEALDRGDGAEAIRLSGDFHLQLARMSGNRVLEYYLEELVSRTSLIIAMYGNAGEAPNCSFTEHSDIIAAIEARDVEKACTVSDHHLCDIENSLNLTSDEETEVDLKKVFDGF